MQYVQIKTFKNTNDEEVNAFIFENRHLSPVIVSATMTALPGYANMLQAEQTVVVQLLITAEPVTETTETTETRKAVVAKG